MVAVAVASIKAKRPKSTNRCETRQRRRFAATSGQSCSAARRGLYEMVCVFWPSAQARVGSEERTTDQDCNAVLGIDLGKNSCSLVGLATNGAVVMRRTSLLTSAVTMEACCGAYCLGRLFVSQAMRRR